MTAAFITVYRQRALPKINEERSVQGQINQIILRIHLQLVFIMFPFHMIILALMNYYKVGTIPSKQLCWFYMHTL